MIINKDNISLEEMKQAIIGMILEDADWPVLKKTQWRKESMLVRVVHMLDSPGYHKNIFIILSNEKKVISKKYLHQKL